MTTAHTHEVATATATIDPVLVEQANNAEVERQLLYRCHPTAMERMAHRTNDCDGSCARMYNGFEHLLES